MVKQLFLVFFILYSVTVFSQEKSAIDSLENSIISLPKNFQLQKIKSLSHDQITNNISQSEKLLKKGEEIAIELNDSLSLAEIYKKLSIAYSYSENLEKKFDYSQKSITIFEKLGKDEEAGAGYGDLGYSLKYTDRKKAIEYMVRAIKLLEKTNNLKALDPIYDNYGTIFDITNEIDSAIYYHNKSLLIKKQFNDSVGLGYTYAHISTSYSLINEFEKSRKYLDSSSVIRKKINEVYGVAANYAHLGDIYFNEKKIRQAINTYKSGISLAKNGNFKHLERYFYEMISKSYEELKDYKNAYKYNHIFQQKKDSVINENTNKRIAELKIEFETEKKEKEIAQQKEEILEKEIEIKNKNLFNIALGAGILLISLLSFGIYKYQKNKRQQLRTQLALKDELAKSQTQNKLQEQRLRISRDLHDNIGSQLTFIISSIDNLKFLTKKSDEKLKDKLSSINSFANNTISQLRDTIWAMNKNEITFEDFYGRLLTFVEKAKLAKNDIEFNLSNSITSSPTFSSVEGINIFRVIQESVNNTIKYANASKIDIQLSENEKNIHFLVIDNGVGFDINEVEMGNGLNNMQSRISEINGLFKIESTPKKGTQIEFSIPKNT